MDQNRIQPQHRIGFTLIEIMIAVAVIAILVGILLFAGRGVIENSKERATRVTLASVSGMFGEFDSQTRLSKSPINWAWYDKGSIVNPPPGTASPGSPDFWRIPYFDTSVSPNLPEAMDAPGLVVADNPDTRNASRAVLNTQLVMDYLLAMPVNRKALEQYRADQYMIPTWSPSTSIPSPGSDGVLHTPDDGTESPAYMAGARVQYNGQRYICTNSYPTNSGPPPGSGWALDSGPVYPIFLDGWGNPIIFVPGSGLRVRLLNGAKDYNDTTPNLVQTVIIISPEGKLDSTGTKVLQPGRPFWASAGPDGDFAKGDDNLYSFQQ